MAARKKPGKKAKKKPSRKRAPPRKKLAKKKPLRRKRRVFDAPTFPLPAETTAGVQSGDLQGLSNVERADSESVDELLEEGNAFEAEVVKGVEDAGDADEKSVITREVPEDDVPGEYLDEEQ